MLIKQALTLILLSIHFSEHKKEKEKSENNEVSVARVAAVAASGGLLALVVGVHKKRKGAHVWFCQDCGCEFTK